uniref:BOLA class I histocompatibility antigen, alpha chain BL3-7-like n=1 Tax=Erpetoichthys calabaricus TaxID=27687 RepID=A0A8C4SUX5_ERPCA
MLPVQLVFFLCGFHGTLAGSHSYWYMYTGVSGAEGFPEFTGIGMVDDLEVYYYDSIRKAPIPEEHLLNKEEKLNLYRGNEGIVTGVQQNFKANIAILMNRFNKSKGIHTLQMMSGCELNDDGTTQGFWQYGFDGDNFISFDKQTLTWTAASQHGQTTKARWDSNKAVNEYSKGYLEGTCLEWLKKYVQYGAKTLERKVHPEVFLTHKRTDSRMEAICYVTGFFPRDIVVTWHNGGSHDLDVESGEVLPNEDGTYQVKKTLKLRIKPEELKKGDYSCCVVHSSLAGNITIELDPAMMNLNEPFSILIIAVVMGILFAVAIGTGMVIWKMKTSGAKNVKYIQAQSVGGIEDGWASQLGEKKISYLNGRLREGIKVSHPREGTGPDTIETPQVDGQTEKKISSLDGKPLANGQASRPDVVPVLSLEARKEEDREGLSLGHVYPPPRC